VIWGIFQRVASSCSTPFVVELNKLGAIIDHEEENFRGQQARSYWAPQTKKSGVQVPRPLGSDAYVH